MKKYILHIFILSWMIPLSITCVFAQDRTPPDHRFAVRWNTLGIPNLDAIGEIEYSPTNKIGLFVGGGSSFGLVYPYRIYGYGGDFRDKCKSANWGIYLGARVAIPIGKLTGLNVKAAFCYQHNKLFDATNCLQNPDDVPAPPSIVFRQSMSGYLSIAYNQAFAKRFFLEPVIGIGPSFHANGVDARYAYSGFDLPIQLNLGVRF